MLPVAGFLLSAILGILSFPPIGLWFLAYVAFVPFLASCVTLSPRRALRWGYVGGFVFYGGLLYWIGLNLGAPPALRWSSFVAAVAILATVWAITAWAVSRVTRRFGLGWALLLFVILQVYFEVFWGTGELGFPWAIWAISQIRFLPAVQIADLGDVWLVSLWVMSLNALLFMAWKAPALRRRLLIISAALFLCPVLYGVVRMSQVDDGKGISVAAVQGNTEIDEKWEKSPDEILDVYLDLTRSLSGTATTLAVWPETATPMALRFKPSALVKLHALCDSLQTAIFTGATDYKEAAGRGMAPLNAGFLVRPQSPILESSAKVHLVPFGERIPEQKYFPFLGKLHLGQAEFLAAPSTHVFPANGPLAAFGSLICYEVVFPDISASLVKDGAQFLANITEDGWYGNSSGPYQHLALSRLRAVAVRRGIIRSANTGISAVILPSGRLSATLAYDRQGIVRGTLPVRSGVTLSAHLAKTWPYVYSILLAAVLALLFWKSRRDKTTPPMVA